MNPHHCHSPRLKEGEWQAHWSHRHVQPAIKAATPDHSIHDFRHNFTTTMLARGVDITTVAALLDDTVETVAKTYVHYTQEMRGAARTCKSVLII